MRPDHRLVGVLILASACSTGYGLRLHAPASGDATPVLRWGASAAEAASYDLRIFREADGELVYERTALKGCEHEVATPLPPGGYRWTVRIRRETSAGPRVGPWSLEDADSARRRLAPAPKQSMHRFTVEPGWSRHTAPG